MTYKLQVNSEINGKVPTDMSAPPATTRGSPGLSPPAAARYKVNGHTTPAWSQQSGTFTYPGTNSSSTPTARATTSREAVTPNSGRYVRVILLDKSDLQIRIEPKQKLEQIFNDVCEHLHLRESEFFGLAQLVDNQYNFLDKNTKLQKLLPRGWKFPHRGQTNQNNNQPQLTLYFKVQYYVDNIKLLRERNSRQIYYQQLHDNLLHYDRLCTEERCFLLASYALQANCGVYDATLHASKSFDPREYFPPWVLKKHGREYLMDSMSKLHKDRKDMPRYDAQMAFIKEISVDSAAHNLHFYRLKKRKTDLQQKSWLGICPAGIEIYEEQDNGFKLFKTRHEWSAISNISYKKKKFKFDIIAERKLKHVFYTTSDECSVALFLLCRNTHECCQSLQSKLQELKHMEEADRRNNYKDREIVVGSNIKSPIPHHVEDHRQSVLSTTSSSTDTSGVVTSSFEEPYPEYDEIIINSPPVAQPDKSLTPRRPYIGLPTFAVPSPLLNDSSNPSTPTNNNIYTISGTSSVIARSSIKQMMALSRTSSTHSRSSQRSTKLPLTPNTILRTSARHSLRSHTPEPTTVISHTSTSSPLPASMARVVTPVPVSTIVRSKTVAPNVSPMPVIAGIAGRVSSSDDATKSANTSSSVSNSQTDRELSSLENSMHSVQITQAISEQAQSQQQQMVMQEQQKILVEEQRRRKLEDQIMIHRHMELQGQQRQQLQMREQLQAKEQEKLKLQKEKDHLLFQLSLEQRQRLQLEEQKLIDDQEKWKYQQLLHNKTHLPQQQTAMSTVQRQQYVTPHYDVNYTVDVPHSYIPTNLQPGAYVPVYGTTQGGAYTSYTTPEFPTQVEPYPAVTTEARSTEQPELPLYHQGTRSTEQPELPLYHQGTRSTEQAELPLYHQGTVQNNQMSEEVFYQNESELRAIYQQQHGAPAIQEPVFSTPVAQYHENTANMVPYLQNTSSDEPVFETVPQIVPPQPTTSYDGPKHYRTNDYVNEPTNFASRPASIATTSALPSYDHLMMNHQQRPHSVAINPSTMMYEQLFAAQPLEQPTGAQPPPAYRQPTATSHGVPPISTALANVSGGVLANISGGLANISGGGLANVSGGGLSMASGSPASSIHIQRRRHSIEQEVPAWGTPSPRQHEKRREQRWKTCPVREEDVREEVNTMKQIKRKTLSFPMLNGLMLDPNLSAGISDDSAKEISVATRTKTRSASDEENRPLSHTLYPSSWQNAGSVPASLDTLSAAPGYSMHYEFDDHHNRARSWETAAQSLYNQYAAQSCGNQNGIDHGYLSSRSHDGHGSPHISMMTQRHIAT